MGRVPTDNGRVRILHLTDRLTDRGGAYWHLLGVLESLAAEHELHLAVGRVEGKVGAPCPVSVVPGLASRTRNPCAIEELAAGLRPDVIHVHTVVNPQVLEWAADREAVMTVQDHRYFCPGRGMWTAAGATCSETLSREACVSCFDDERYFRTMLRLTEQRLRALRRLRLTVLSEYMKQRLVQAGVTEDRVCVIPPFVHGLSRNAEPEGDPCVLFVGRFARAKGVFDAIEAWRLSGLDLPLALAGAGRFHPGLEHPGIEALGWVPHQRLSAQYARARVVVMPSRWQEPFGIVGLEALWMGTAVVAWDSGGVKEWHGAEGLLPWGDVAGLARALPAALERTAAASPGFEREPLMRRLLDLYEAARR